MTHPMTAFVRWAMTPPMRATFMAFRKTLLMPSLDGDDPEVLDRVLSHEARNVLFGTVIEAFATLRIERASSFGTAFALSGAGRADVQAADYCRQLQKAPFRLYRIEGVSRGEGLELRATDAVAESVFVHDVRASQWLEPGGYLVARIVDWDGRNELAGGMLPFLAKDGATAVREYAKFGQEAALSDSADPLETIFASPEACFLNAWVAVQLSATEQMSKPKRRACKRA